MGDLVQFVDSIASSPTVLLNINDETSWWVNSFSAPPPRLRRSVSSNAMRDGGVVSSSSYDNRVLSIELYLRAANQDTWATEFQKLARILDGGSSILKYQPTGASKPVFFKVFRSDVASILEMLASAAFRVPVIELYAEPFALGLRETISVGTVNNDPAAGANGCYFDVTGVLGDVAAPMVFTDTVNDATLGDCQVVLAVRQSGTPANLPTFIQAESLTPATDTSNPGGAADGAMSGSGTTNYLRTTFATSSGVDVRATGVLTSTGSALLELPGAYRAYLTCRRSSAVGSVSVQLIAGAVTSGIVETGLQTSRQMVDLGLVSFVSDRSTTYPRADVGVLAGRLSGTSTLDLDCVQFVPAGEAMLIAVGASFDGVDFVADGEQDSLYTVDNAANLFTGAARAADGGLAWAGSVPKLRPGVTNRFVYLKSVPGSAAVTTMTKTTTGTVTIYYNPCYLYVRPSAT